MNHNANNNANHNAILPASTTPVAKRLTQRALGNEEMSHPPGVFQHPCNSGNACKTVASTRVFSNPKILDAVKCVRDIYYYSYKRPGVFRFDVEYMCLEGMFGTRDLQVIQAQLCDIIANLTPRRRANLEPDLREITSHLQVPAPVEEPVEPEEPAEPEKPEESVMVVANINADAAHERDIQQPRRQMSLKRLVRRCLNRIATRDAYLPYHGIRVNPIVYPPALHKPEISIQTLDMHLRLREIRHLKAFCDWQLLFMGLRDQSRALAFQRAKEEVEAEKEAEDMAIECFVQSSPEASAPAWIPEVDGDPEFDSDTDNEVIAEMNADGITPQAPADDVMAQELEAIFDSDTSPGSSNSSNGFQCIQLPKKTKITKLAPIFRHKGKIIQLDLSDVVEEPADTTQSLVKEPTPSVSESEMVESSKTFVAPPPNLTVMIPPPPKPAPITQADLEARQADMAFLEEEDTWDPFAEMDQPPEAKAKNKAAMWEEYLKLCGKHNILPAVKASVRKNVLEDALAQLKHDIAHPPTDEPKFEMVVPQPYNPTPVDEDKSELAEYNFLHPEDRFDPYPYLNDEVDTPDTTIQLMPPPAPTAPLVPPPPPIQARYPPLNVTFRSGGVLEPDGKRCKLCGVICMMKDIHIDGTCKTCIRKKMQASAEPVLERKQDKPDASSVLSFPPKLSPSYTYEAHELPPPSGTEGLGVGNLEHYMDVNQLTEDDFKDTHWDTVIATIRQHQLHNLMVEEMRDLWSLTNCYIKAVINDAHDADDDVRAIHDLFDEDDGLLGGSGRDFEINYKGIKRKKVRVGSGNMREQQMAQAAAERKEREIDFMALQEQPGAVAPVTYAQNMYGSELAQMQQMVPYAMTFENNRRNRPRPSNVWRTATPPPLDTDVYVPVSPKQDVISFAPEIYEQEEDEKIAVDYNMDPSLQEALAGPRPLGRESALVIENINDASREEVPMVGDEVVLDPTRNVQVGPANNPAKYKWNPLTGMYEIVKRGRPALPPELKKYQKRYERPGRPPGARSKIKAVSSATLPRWAIEEYKQAHPPRRITRAMREAAERKMVEDFVGDAEAPAVTHPLREYVRVGPRTLQAARKAAALATLKARDRVETQTKYAQLLQRAKELGEPYLSEQLYNIWTRTVRITKKKPVSFVHFAFNIVTHPTEYAVSDVVASFTHQTQYLQSFIQGLLKREITRWKMTFTVVTGFGNTYIHSTNMMTGYARCMSDVMRRIGDIEDGYEEDGFHITKLEVVAVLGTNRLIGGAKELEERRNQLAADWVVINPSSKFNCLWTAIAIATGYTKNPKLMWSNKVQNGAGKNFKRNVGTDNVKGGNKVDLQKCANYKACNIMVHNEVGEVLDTIHPHARIIAREEAPTIHLLLFSAHYHAMLPKSCPVVLEHMHMLGEQARDLAPIAQYEKEHAVRRIVSYDIESFKDPKDPFDEEEKEYDQVAYAIGWCFFVKDVEEELLCEQLGYSIHQYEMHGKKYVAAYQMVLGHGCLDDALYQWMEQPMFHEAVFYAHNGGKFDLRLILGQSDLMYKPNYAIQASGQIVLNGRIINLDVHNWAAKHEVTTARGQERSEPQKISLRDSIPLFGADCSLAKVCKELDVAHKKLEEKVGIHDLMYANTWRRIWDEEGMGRYLENDCLGLLEVLTLFNDQVLAATRIPITSVNTGASLAKKFYLQDYYKPSDEDGIGDKQSTVFTLTPDIDAFIRDGYGGGRCEAFVSKEVTEPCYYYDFTSLYPDVARGLMPTGSPQYIVDEDMEPEVRDRFIRNKWQRRILEGQRDHTIAYWKVKVRSPLAAAGKPMDPLKRKPLFGQKEGGMYMFRWYTEWTEMTLFEPEILEAIRFGLDYEFEPINALVFSTNPILAPCMEHLFKMKAEAKENGNPALSKTWKIIINSLYGVWGLRIMDREGIEIALPEQSTWSLDMAREKLMDVEKIGQYVVTRRTHNLEVSDCNVSIAAAVTSYARIKLYRLFADIQDKGGHILYCDTDSIITNYCIEEDAALRNKWMGPSMGKELGSLKNEIEECYDKHRSLTRKYHFERAVIVAPKLYVVQAEGGVIQKCAHKGFRSSRDEPVTYQMIKTLVDESIPEAQRTMEQTTVQWLGGNGDIVKNQIGVKNVKRRKIIRRKINKGIVVTDGQVIPYVTAPQ